MFYAGVGLGYMCTNSIKLCGKLQLWCKRLRHKMFLKEYSLDTLRITHRESFQKNELQSHTCHLQSLFTDTVSNLYVQI